MKKAILIIIGLFCVPGAATAQPVAPEQTAPDWPAYAGLLHDHVHAGEKDGVHVNLVDYPAWRADPRWPALLASLRDFDAARLRGRNDKLAFWINAYNILAIRMVLDHAPLSSIRDAGSLFSPVWSKPAGVVAGKMRTLHEIEHEILRGMGEPRIHFAIVCASVSCPDLRREPYRAAMLEAQLNNQAKNFLNTPGKGLNIGDNGIYLSKIFDWFADDFAASGGITAFISRYRKLPDTPTRRISFLNYNWSLNAASRLHKTESGHS